MKKRLNINFSPLDTSGAFNPKANYMYQYFLKVVGVQYSFLGGEIAKSHQFSVTTYERDLSQGPGAGKNAQGLMTSHGVPGVPGLFINYDVSPMMVVHHERRQSFAHFLTSMCAIIGGVLTVASILDSAMFRGQKLVKKAAEKTASSSNERAPLMGYGGSGYGPSGKMM